MTTVLLPIGEWIWTLGLLLLAAFAAIRAYANIMSGRIDVALSLLGLYVAAGIIILSLSVSVADSELTTHRHNCIMYELALQRNANPGLTNVVIDPAWHDLECYPTP